jgi:hypothetical protein
MDFADFALSDEVFDVAGRDLQDRSNLNLLDGEKLWPVQVWKCKLLHGRVSFDYESNQPQLYAPTRMRSATKTLIWTRFRFGGIIGGSA